LIIRYLASRQKRQEYNWQQIDIWAFRSSLPTGRQASSVFCPKKKENKATSVIADTHNIFSKTIQYKMLQRIFSKITVTRWSNIPFPNRIAELFLL
jgi:hypothetical protein